MFEFKLLVNMNKTIFIKSGNQLFLFGKSIMYNIFNQN